MSSGDNIPATKSWDAKATIWISKLADNKWKKPFWPMLMRIFFTSILLDILHFWFIPCKLNFGSDLISCYVLQITGYHRKEILYWQLTLVLNKRNEFFFNYIPVICRPGNIQRICCLFRISRWMCDVIHNMSGYRLNIIRIAQIPKVYVFYFLPDWLQVWINNRPSASQVIEQLDRQAMCIFNIHLT